MEGAAGFAEDLPREVHGHGDVAIGLQLDADGPAKGFADAEMDGFAASPLRGMSFFHLHDQAELDQLVDLIGHRRLVQTQAIRDADAADAGPPPDGAEDSGSSVGFAVGVCLHDS